MAVLTAIVEFAAVLSKAIVMVSVLTGYLVGKRLWQAARLERQGPPFSAH